MGFLSAPQAWLVLLLSYILLLVVAQQVQALGVNWGTQASHNLSPSIVVRMLQDNKIDKVKLFDSEESTLKALVGTDIEVMVAIPNKYLEAMTDADEAAKWVKRNVDKYIFEGGVNIKYVAVGNEPFLVSYNGSFIDLTFPALKNIQTALTDLNLGDLIKATVPMNADVYTDSGSGLPSHGTFRTDVSQQMLQIVEFLHQNNCPFTVNIYPFISLYADASFPRDYAYFDGNGTTTITDGQKVYRNTFDASYDTLVAALKSAGYPDMPIVVGEVGWPTDGFTDATPANAQRFVQGFLNHVATNAGTPSKPNIAIEYYLFALLDEDQKSISPGNFETHWGIFRYDGRAKYALTLPAPANGNSQQIVDASGVSYLQQRWCVLADDASTADLEAPVSFACTYSDCTSLGYGCSCNSALQSSRQNASYAFNQYFQVKNQGSGTCDFDGLASITYSDPSVGTCQFIVQLDADSSFSAASGLARTSSVVLITAIVATLLLFALPGQTRTALS